ncbi:hypothetical protein Lmor_1018 [Legionella moravica]|uniref:Uncharacterized protein n=1 Tax=Legionella moravica TaxID=39962 RepID=A0A378K0D9_9GAMM|nr:hypothetical protein [Legionella moravica]KTD35571.1 hypothetical protein Lmor_1018 [Legionella moravica]STX62719.1 Uncharacterised protein [Legionella moravica]
MPIKDRDHFMSLVAASFGEQFREPVFAPHVTTTDQYLGRALLGLNRIHERELKGEEYDLKLKLNYQASVIGYLEKEAEAWYQRYKTDPHKDSDTYLDFVMQVDANRSQYYELGIIDYVKKCNECKDNDVFINVVKGILRTADTSLSKRDDPALEEKLDSLCSPTESQEHIISSRMTP